MSMYASILMAASVYLTDYMEMGSGMFSGLPAGIDMDWINVVLAGMQSGMMNLGLAYVSEDTLADLMKPILGLVGIGGGIIPAIGFEIAGLVSCVPQMDQFYKEHIWPIAKLALGASLMGGPTSVISSALANTIAINLINTAQQAFMNTLFLDPTLNDVTMDFSAILEYAPGGCGGYDYISNYISHYICGMW
ncbi:MAG: hypothetical protein ACETWM_06120 [Candidatus Lokiarchaeia archaeon]